MGAFRAKHLGLKSLNYFYSPGHDVTNKTFLSAHFSMQWELSNHILQEHYKENTKFRSNRRSVIAACILSSKESHSFAVLKRRRWNIWRSGSWKLAGNESCIIRTRYLRRAFFLSAQFIELWFNIQRRADLAVEWKSFTSREVIKVSHCCRNRCLKRRDADVVLWSWHNLCRTILSPSWSQCLGARWEKKARYICDRLSSCSIWWSKQSCVVATIHDEHCASWMYKLIISTIQSKIWLIWTELSSSSRETTVYIMSVRGILIMGNFRRRRAVKSEVQFRISALVATERYSKNSCSEDAFVCKSVSAAV